MVDIKHYYVVLEEYDAFTQCMCECIHTLLFSTEEGQCFSWKIIFGAMFFLSFQYNCIMLYVTSDVAQ